MASTNTGKVTARSSKEALFAAYQESQAALKEKNSKSLDPDAVRRRKRVKEVTDKTQNLSTESIENGLRSVERKALDLMTGIKSQIGEQMEQFHTVQEALAAKQAELKEIFDIEHEAETLAALVQAQTDQREAFQADLEAQETDFREQMARERKVWQDEQTEHERQFTLKVALDEQQRQRDMETFKYNFARDERERLDQTTDELNRLKKDHAEQVELRNKAAIAREEAVQKREETMNSLNNQIATLEARLKTDVDAAVAETKSNMAASKEIAVNAVTQKFNADLTVANGKLAALEKENIRLVGQVTSLETKLENAYAQINSTALAALQAQGNAATTKQVIEATAAAQAGKSTR